jgi:hypothetical protein
VHPVSVGCCGWSYKDWRGVFYPERLPESQYLPYYAEHYAIGAKGTGTCHNIYRYCGMSLFRLPVLFRLPPSRLGASGSPSIADYRRADRRGFPLLRPVAAASACVSTSCRPTARA